MNAKCQTPIGRNAKRSEKPWRPLGESNPSYQIENLASYPIHEGGGAGRGIIGFGSARNRRGPTAAVASGKQAQAWWCVRSPISHSYHLPVFGIEAHGSAADSASPFCRSSIETLSGERMNAMRPSRGGRLMVTPASISDWQVA